MILGRVILEPGPRIPLQAGLKPAVEMQKRSHARWTGPARDALDYVLFLPAIWLLCGLSVYIKLGGTLMLLAVLASFLAYAVLRRTWPPLWLSAFVAFCLLCGLASHYRLFPPSWQIYFRDEAIVRQLAPVISFFIASWASKAFFTRRLLAGDAFSGGAPILFLSFVVAPILLFQQGFQYEGDDPLTSAIAMYGSFVNNVVIALYFVTAAACFGTGWRRYVSSTFLFAIAVVSEFAQFRVMIAGAAAVLFGLPGRLTIISLLIALIGMYCVGAIYLHDLLLAAPNSGIRLVFIADAFKSTFDTYGLGIGYGTESVRWRYYFPDRPVFTFLAEPATITPEQMLENLSVGVHNSFIQALLRTGVIGFGLLITCFVAAFPRRDLPRGIKNHAAILFSIIAIACFVNPALESPVQGLGVGYVYGYLIALRSFRGVLPRQLRV